MHQTQKINNLDSLVERLKPYLRRYLEERDVQINDRGWFLCINPKHEDTHPTNCGFIKGTNEERFFCFACGAKGSITDAAHLLENKSIDGIEFVEDNLLYLADKYGIEYDKIEVTPEELRLRRIYSAYEEAADIVSEHQPLEYIAARKWPVSLCRELQIGSVRSYEEFARKMSNRGYEKRFIDEVDLNKSIFNKGMLIFSVKDERNRVVGFSARNMSHSKESKNLKFINTSAKCPIYNKSGVLYGLGLAKREIQPLYIFEGYPDFVSAYKHNMKNICAIGGTALTRGHVALLKQLNITDCVLALDGDKAGQLKTQKLLDEYFSGDETMRIRVQKMSETAGESDPDDYIETHGIDKFKELPLFTPFQWRLDRFSYDAKSEYICDSLIPLIINDPNEVHRETMARELSERTGIRLKTILKQLDKILNLEEAKRDGQVQLRLKQTIEDLRFSKDDPVSILETTADDIKKIHVTNDDTVHSAEEVISFLDEAKDMFSSRKPGLQGWKTGFDNLDTSISGIPKEDVMITFAGDSNVGKTGFMFQLALNLAKNNDNIMVLFLSIDDSRQQAIARLVALESQLRINQISHPSENVDSDDAKQALNDGWKSIRDLVDSGRFSIKDNSHGNTLDFAERWIRWAKANNPKKEIVFFLDNFHKLGDERNKDERIRFKHASARIHAMKNKLHFTAICTMEIRKLLNTQRAQRPVLQDISESKQMEYDNNMIGMIYNDMHARRKDAKVFWAEMDLGGSVIKKPVLEIDIQKNKISEFKGMLFYKFSPEHSRFYEVSEAEVKEWSREYDEALRHTLDKKYPQGGDNPFISSSSVDVY